MNRFLDVVPLVITPLTPIHIGCGEDFEPTNYVIDGGVLHHFEPARLKMSQEDRRLLTQSANRRGDELGRSGRASYRPAARVVLRGRGRLLSNRVAPDER